MARTNELFPVPGGPRKRACSPASTAARALSIASRRSGNLLARSVRSCCSCESAVVMVGPRVTGSRSGGLGLQQALHLEGQLAERGLEVLNLDLQDGVVEAGLRAEALERLETPGERGGSLRRIDEEALDLGAQRTDLLVERG